MVFEVGEEPTVEDNTDQQTTALDVDSSKWDINGRYVEI